jgi:DNA recombination protein RmuC
VCPCRAEDHLLLPIDSKFPGDSLTGICRTPWNQGDETAIKAAQKTLCSRIVDESKDISGKYLVPGTTTDFGILFLPFEGLYATAVDLGLSETVQQWHVVLAGPSTLLAILNCVLMMNRFLTVQEQSKRLFTVVQRLQKEFENYHNAMTNLRTHFQRVGDDLDKLTATRWNKLQKCFGELEQLKPPDGTAAGGTAADAAAHRQYGFRCPAAGRERSGAATPFVTQKDLPVLLFLCPVIMSCYCPGNLLR